MSMRNPFHWDQNRDAVGDFTTVKTLKQRYVLVPDSARDAFLVYFARSYSTDNVSMILFCNTVVRKWSNCVVALSHFIW